MDIITEILSVQKALRAALVACRRHGIEVKDLPNGATILGGAVAPEYDGIRLNFWFSGMLLVCDEGVLQQPNMEFNLLGRSQARLAHIDGGIWLLHTGKVHHKNSRPNWNVRVEIQGKTYFKLAGTDDANFAGNILKFYRSAMDHVKSLELAFRDLVGKSLLDGENTRLDRLKSAQKNPERRVVSAIVYDRNPDVVAQRLFMANGICEACNAPAPFIRESDGTPYLEVHHLNSLSKGGEDTVANTIAICPNCHRLYHFGPNS